MLKKTPKFKITVEDKDYSKQCNAYNVIYSIETLSNPKKNTPNNTVLNDTTLNNESSIEITFYDFEPKYEHNYGTWEGNGTFYGGGWIEVPGDELVNVESKIDIEFLYDGSIISEEFFKLVNHLSETDIEELKSLVASDGEYIFQKWAFSDESNF